MNGHVESKNYSGDHAGHGLGPAHSADLGTILARDRARTKHKQYRRREKQAVKLSGLKRDVAKLEALRAVSESTKHLVKTDNPSVLGRIVSRFKGLFRKGEK